MALEFDFREIAARILFDYIANRFPEWWQKNKRKFDLPDLKGINKEQIKGAKYFMRLKVSYKGKVYEFPNEPLISLGISKTIVKTPTVGKLRKGAVLEYITTENYVINIKGICMDLENPQLYPAEQVSLLNEIADINDALEIESNPFFELFGVRRIVIEDINFDEMEGKAGVQTYSISAISDSDFYANLNDLDVSKINLLS